MKKLPNILLGLIVAAILVTISSIAIAAFVTRDAQLVQLVQPDEGGAASLFADSSAGFGTPIGSPQTMIIADPKAFLPGVGSSGEKYVNDVYLRTNSIYPLQVKTVNFLRDLIAWIAGIGAVLISTVRWWLMRRIPVLIR